MEPWENGRNRKPLMFTRVMTVHFLDRQKKTKKEKQRQREQVKPCAFAPNGDAFHTGN